MTHDDEQQPAIHRPITRREFLADATQCIGVMAAASTAIPVVSRAAAAPSVENNSSPAASDANNPPALQGMRGQNQASLQYAHALRDGTLKESVQDTGETYDLVVVGAGMSGLAAAYYYRKWLPHSKVLIVDNCDDFGGHARRNEFVVDGKLLLVNGGAVLILYPGTYSPEGKALLIDIGIDAKRYFEATKQDATLFDRMKLGTGVFFNKEEWGAERLVTGYPGLQVGLEPQVGEQWKAFVSKAPFDRKTADDLLRIANQRRDNLPGLTVQQKIARLQKMSYASYLREVMHVGAPAVRFYQNQIGWVTSGGACGPDSFSAWFAYRCGFGGFQGMGLPREALNISGYLDDSEIGVPIMLPDGMGGVARLLVRWLIPRALPGETMEDSVTARLNYGALDEPGSAVRLRLNSTVVHAEHMGDPATAREAAVTYVRDGRGYTVKARSVVMACFNAIVPYICPQLPQEQREALHSAVRKPLAVVNVAVRNWRSFAKPGVSTVVCPTGFYREFYLSSCPGMGSYRCSQGPDEPTIVQFAGAWEVSGLPPREQCKVGRAQLLGISLETFEQQAREHLQRALGPHGFEADRDVAGITVNRWGHGLTTGANELYDPDWPRDQLPWVKARKRFGLIAIANSDAGRIALTQGAFEQAYRAVEELIVDVVRPQNVVAWGERV